MKGVGNRRLEIGIWGSVSRRVRGANIPYAARPVLFLVVRDANKPSRRVLCAILLFAARTYLRGANCT